MSKKKFTIGGLKSTHGLPNERMLIHGPEKVGKTTFICSAPDVVALDIEGRMGHMDVPAWSIDSWEDSVDALETLLHDDHSFQNVAIDSASYLERYLKDHICRKNRWTAEEASDFARWNRLAKESYWPQFFVMLERLDREKNMGVLMSAHTVEKELRAINGDPYHRFIPDLCGKSPEIFKHWCHFIGFASTNDMIIRQKVEGRTVVRTRTADESILYCRHTPRYDAGSSYSLPSYLPLDYEEYVKAREHGQDVAAHLIEQIEELLADHPKPFQKQVRDWIGDGKNIGRLEAAVARLQEKAQESDNENEE